MCVSYRGCLLFVSIFPHFLRHYFKFYITCINLRTIYMPHPLVFTPPGSAYGLLSFRPHCLHTQPQFVASRKIQKEKHQKIHINFKLPLSIQLQSFLCSILYRCIGMTACTLSFHFVTFHSCFCVKIFPQGFLGYGHCPRPVPCLQYLKS